MSIRSDSSRDDCLDGPDGGRARRWLSGLERRWWTLIAVCGATFMLLVDITIVQVALPTIQRRLGGSFTEMQWVIDAYAVALAAFSLACGSVADRLGRKTVFVGGRLLPAVSPPTEPSRPVRRSACRGSSASTFRTASAC